VARRFVGCLGKVLGKGKDGCLGLGCRGKGSFIMLVGGVIVMCRGSSSLILFWFGFWVDPWYSVSR